MPAQAQQVCDIHEMLQTDTIIHLSDRFLQGSSTRDWIMHGKGNNLYILCQQPQTQTDSVYLLSIDLTTKHIQTSVFSMNKIKQESESGVTDFALYQNLIVLLFHHEAVIFDRYTQMLLTKVHLKDAGSFEHIAMIHAGEIVVWRNYPLKQSKKKSIAEPCMIARVSIEKSKVIKRVTYSTGILQMAYFSPYQMTDVNENGFIVGNNLHIEAQFYSPELEKVCCGFSDKSRLNPFTKTDTATLSQLLAMSQNNTETMMNYLAPKFTREASLADGYFYLDSNKVLIRYNQGTDKSFAASRYFECWRYLPDQRKWESTDTAYLYTIPGSYAQLKPWDTLQSKNYLGSFWPEKCLFLSSYTAVLQNGCPVYPLGLTKQAYEDAKKKYFATHAPVPILTLYKNKF